MIIRDQTKTARYRLTLARRVVAKKPIDNQCWMTVEKREPSYTAGANVNWCSHSGEQCGGSSESSKKTELPDWGILPLDMSSDRTTIQKYTYIPRFIATLFTIAKTWKLPKCPSIDARIKRMWNGILAIENNEIMPFAVMWMDLEIIILSKIILRKTNIIQYHLYVESKIWYK